MIESEVQYRIATIDDVPDIARLRLSDSIEGPADPRMARYLEGKHHPHEALPPRVIYVAETGHALVGYIAGHLTRRYDCDGELQWIYVAPEHRRCGIASQLLRTLAAWFDQNHAALVCVDVTPENLTARSFYHRHAAVELNPHWLEWRNIRTVLLES